jgi:hypothetical protein
VDLLHREQGPGFVRPDHNLIIALEVPAGGPISNLPMPALRFGAGTPSSKDNQFRPTEGMSGRDPDEAIVLELLSVYALLVPIFRRVADHPRQRTPDTTHLTSRKWRTSPLVAGRKIGPSKENTPPPSLALLNHRKIPNIDSNEGKHNEEQDDTWIAAEG